MSKKSGMKAIYALALVFLFVLTAGKVLAASSSGINVAYSYCVLSVNLVQQDPYPAIPGEYVDLLFQVSGVDNSNCNGTKFMVVPQYPFSSDTNDTVRMLSSYVYVPGVAGIAWNIPYRLRVDKDAVSGMNEITVKYGDGNDWTSYMTKTFNVSVTDYRTSFDAVVQDVSGSQVSIAIANTGVNTANAMIVRIPPQENFMVEGPSNGQMVGNLAGGDYSVVSFSIVPTNLVGSYQRDRNVTGAQQQLNGTTHPFQARNTSLKLQIDYTDGVGVRRTSIIAIPLNLNSFLTNSTGYITRNASSLRSRSSSSTSVASKWYFWVGIIAVIALGTFFYYHKKRKNSWFESEGEEPEWVKREKLRMKTNNKKV
ncbi:MAG: hypothetical protein QXW00_02125 [Candidatus Woesearchaeota archaeon]